VAVAAAAVVAATATVAAITDRRLNCCQIRL